MLRSDASRLSSLGDLLRILAIVACLACLDRIQASPVELSLGLTNGGGELHQAHLSQQQISGRVQQIMNDEYQNDFRLSISLLNQFSAGLSEFIKAEHLDGKVQEGPNVIKSWAAAKGATNRAVVNELDFIVGTFWSQFQPLIKTIIAQRPQGLSQADLDFRCIRRTNELGDLMALGAQSSLYSIFMDTFLSEFYVHCLYRKLALLKINNIAPTPLVKQFVDIYLNLPAQSSGMGVQESTTDHMLVSRAAGFSLQKALATGPLSAAAALVVDPRTFLSTTNDQNKVHQMVQEFERDCNIYNSQLGSVWRDYDDFTKALSTQTTNLENFNQQIKFACPQLVYGLICGQLLQLPR
jgi:hypothetical protein